VTQFKLFAGRPKDAIRKANEWLAAKDRYIHDLQVVLDGGDPGAAGWMYIVVEYETDVPDEEGE
jgi:hypothetical protein